MASPTARLGGPGAVLRPPRRSSGNRLAVPRPPVWAAGELGNALWGYSGERYLSRQRRGPAAPAPRPGRRRATPTPRCSGVGARPTGRQTARPPTRAAARYRPGAASGWEGCGPAPGGAEAETG